MTDEGHMDVRTVVVNPEEQKVSENLKVSESMSSTYISSAPRVIFIIPFALPNSGKSFTWK